MVNLLFRTALTFCIFASVAFAQKIEHGQRFRALVIGIDGAKGLPFYQRVFLSPHAKNLKQIAAFGQYARCYALTDNACARTHLGPRFNPAYTWVTSSGWASVLTGGNTFDHLVRGNHFEDQSVFYKTTKRYPTFLWKLKQQGLITAAGGVGCFISSINKAGTSDQTLSTGILDFECGIDQARHSSSVPPHAKNSCNTDYRISLDGSDPSRDEKLTAWFLSMINTDNLSSPDVIMGVYDTLDDAGHEYGYDDNPGYMSAISNIDRMVGTVLKALERRVTTQKEAWLIIVTSDHGGHSKPTGGGSHNDVYWHDEIVPFVIGVMGDRIQLKHTGAMHENDVTQMDAAASILHWFDVTSLPTQGIVRSQYHWQTTRKK